MSTKPTYDPRAVIITVQGGHVVYFRNPFTGNRMDFFTKDFQLAADLNRALEAPTIEKIDRVLARLKR